MKCSLLSRALVRFLPRILSFEVLEEHSIQSEVMQRLGILVQNPCSRVCCGDRRA